MNGVGASTLKELKADCGGAGGGAKQR